MFHHQERLLFKLVQISDDAMRLQVRPTSSDLQPQISVSSGCVRTYNEAIPESGDRKNC